jgi:hypothetical protein
MQEELNTEYPELNISILAINMIGAEGGTAQAAQSGTLPIVNDNTIDTIWEKWGITANDAPGTETYCTENSEGSFACGGWRDVFILDRQNQPVTVYNLTLNNLSPLHGDCSDPQYTDQGECGDAGETWTTNYDELKQLFIDAATQ